MFSGAALAEPQAIHGQMQELRITAAHSTRDPLAIAESISILGRDEIEAQQPQHLGDLLESLANVSIGGGPRGLAQSVVIRGVADERIVFLLDGARQNFSRAHEGRVAIDPALLKRVEVLRGPASVLWGSGAIGGVVALTTVDASDLLDGDRTVGARVKLGYQGMNDQWHKAATLYGLVGDSIDLMADVSYRTSGDIRLGSGSDLDHSGSDSLAGLFKVSWSDIEHSLSATLQTITEQREVPSNPQTLSTPGNLVDRDTTQRNLSLRYSYEPADIPLLRPTLLLYRNHNEVSERRFADDRRDDTDVETWGVDLRNRFDWEHGAVAHRLTAGIDYFEDRAEASRDGVPRPSFPDAEQRVLGLYLHDEILVGERLALVPGMRWDRYASDSGADVTSGQDASELSTKLALSYALTDWLSMHASYNEAFRAPGISELFVSGTHFSCGPRCANLFVPNPALRPEKARNKEIGLTARQTGVFQPGDRASLRFNIFRNDVTDFIDQIVNFTFTPVPGNPGAGGVSLFENVADARLEGFELELAYDSPSWFASAAYGRTRGDNRTTGGPLSDVPADELTLQGGIRLAQFKIGWKGRLVAEQDRVPQGGTTSDSYDLHDIYLTWMPTTFGKDRVRVDLGIDNLFDSEYRPHLSVLDGPGRNIKATVAVKF